MNSATGLSAWMAIASRAAANHSPSQVLIGVRPSRPLVESERWLIVLAHSGEAARHHAEDDNDTPNHLDKQKPRGGTREFRAWVGQNLSVRPRPHADVRVAGGRRLSGERWTTERAARP